MRVVLHPEVASDISQIMAYFEQVATPKLANEFYAELRNCLLKAGDRPSSFAVREHGVRRVNLRRFPYHFLFQIVRNTVRVLVIRHHHRDPTFGLQRR